jgi:hypothetical protein
MRWYACCGLEDLRLRFLAGVLPPHPRYFRGALRPPAPFTGAFPHLFTLLRGETPLPFRGALRPHTPIGETLAGFPDPLPAKGVIPVSAPVVMPIANNTEMGMITGISIEAAFFAGGLGAGFAPSGEREGQRPLA